MRVGKLHLLLSLAYVMGPPISCTYCIAHALKMHRGPKIVHNLAVIRTIYSPSQFRAREIKYKPYRKWLVCPNKISPIDLESITFLLRYRPSPKPYCLPAKFSQNLTALIIISFAFASKFIVSIIVTLISLSELSSRLKMYLRIILIIFYVNITSNRTYNNS